MVNIDQTGVADNPVILREILQNKDKLAYELIKPHDKSMPENPKAVHNQETNGTERNSEHSSRSVQSSPSGSDEESSFLESGRADEAEADDSKSDLDDQSGTEQQVMSDSKEVKRERMENHSRVQENYSDMESFGEVRKQKRKQTLPQQHESTTKVRRVDGQYYDEDLWSIRNQLTAVQSYFRHYDDSMPKHLNGYGGIGMENIQRWHQAYFANLSAARQAEEARVPTPEQKVSPSSSVERKVTSDQFNIAEHVRETVNANRGLSQSVSDLNDKELNELIASLKSKIEDAVSVTVDKELAAFFKKRNTKPKDSQCNNQKESKEEPNNNREQTHKPEQNERKPTTDHSLNHILQMPDRSNTFSGFRLPERHSAFELPKLSGGMGDMPRAQFPHHPPLGLPPLSFYLPTNLHPPSLYAPPPPEQTEALSLVVNTPKKKRTKVTDTRLSPRAARALLQDNGSMGHMFDHERSMSAHFSSQLNPPCLPTSVAIPNPSLQHSDILSYYKEHSMCSSPTDNGRATPCSSPSESNYNYMKGDFYNDSDNFDSHGKTTDTLTPMHLRKAKLMFFYVRYPSSAILKAFFPDVHFNKNNTAQLVKWFSNFREFYYIQMEKYARQAIAEGCKHTDELMVTPDSELYRVLNLHYNRNNQIEVPENFRLAVQATLREFFLAILATKDAEPSWKKPIYKVIARIDDVIPDYFKSPNWMDQLGDS